jgi:hypothetical protein
VSILSVQCYLIARRRLFEGSQALTTNIDKGNIKIYMEHWWNDTDAGKLKHSVKNLSHCQFVHYTPYID